MRIQDTDVLVKVMHIHNVVSNGKTHEAFVLLIDRQYRATFRYKEDLDHYLDWFKTQVQGRIIIEEAYKNN